MDAILACAASASPRVRRESWDESQKKLFFVPALTFSDNSIGNACQAGKRNMKSANSQQCIWYMRSQIVTIQTMPINMLTTCSSSGEGYCFSWQYKFVFLLNATNAKITVCAQMFTMPNIENRLKTPAVRKQPLVPTTRKQLGLLKINSLQPHLISGQILEKLLKVLCEKHIHLKKASKITILDYIFYHHLPIGSVSSYFSQSNTIAGNVLFQIS